MDNKNAQAGHEREVLTRVSEMVNERNLNNFYGFTAEDVERFCAAFQSVKQNDKTTFPDFYSKSSCIELFNISSSEPTKRGGPAQIMQDGKLKERIKKEDEKAARGTLPARRTYCKTHPAHSYEHLSESLRSQCLKHLGSLRKCESKFNTKIFVIEYREVDLKCGFTPVDGIGVDGIYPSDLLPIYEDGKQFGLYRLSRDKENLLWLQEHLRDVDFLVFAGFEHVEAVNHHRADALAALLPWKFVAACAHAVTFATSECLSVSARESKENE